MRLRISDGCLISIDESSVLKDGFLIYGLLKRSKNRKWSFLSRKVFEFNFGKFNLFWRIHISADLNNLLDGCIINKLMEKVGWNLIKLYSDSLISKCLIYCGLSELVVVLDLKTTWELNWGYLIHPFRQPKLITSRGYNVNFDFLHSCVRLLQKRELLHLLQCYTVTGVTAING